MSDDEFARLREENARLRAATEDVVVSLRGILGHSDEEFRTILNARLALIAALARPEAGEGRP